MSAWDTTAFVISCGQTRTDGIEAAALATAQPGSRWRWSGDAVCIGAVRQALRLETPRAVGTIGAVQPKPRKLPVVRGNREVPAPEDVEEGGAAFVITDGRRMFEFAVIRASATELLVAKGALPPRDTDLWVVRATPATSGARAEVSMVCFTTSTHIATPTGDRPVEDVRPGDLVTTRDNGPQPVLWNGHQHIGGARLYAMPHLRPIRIEAAAFGPGHPDSMLLLSPEHRVLLSGGAARGLFGVEEILVASKHLVDDRRVSTDRASRWVTYHHLMLERHEVLVANGLPCESFHPADADMGGIADDQRNALFEVAPELGAGTTDYGPHARRVLTRAEAALLAYGGH